MGDKYEEPQVFKATDSDGSPPGYDNASVQDDQAYVYKDDQKLGYTATVFIILNKMIGTGSLFRSTIKQNKVTCSQVLQSSPLHRASSQSLAPSASHSSYGSSGAF